MGLDQYIYLSKDEDEVSRRLRIIGYYTDTAGRKFELTFDPDLRCTVKTDPWTNEVLGPYSDSETITYFSGEDEIMYWRKAYAVHQYMLDNTTTPLDEGDNGVFMSIPVKAIKKLLRQYTRVIKVLDDAFAKLPPKQDPIDADDTLIDTDRYVYINDDIAKVLSNTSVLEEVDVGDIVTESDLTTLRFWQKALKAAVAILRKQDAETALYIASY